MDTYVITEYLIHERKDGGLRFSGTTSEYKAQLKGICSLPVKKGIEAICNTLGFRYDYNYLYSITRRESMGQTIVILSYKNDNTEYLVHVNIQKVITTAPTVDEVDNLIR